MPQLNGSHDFGRFNPAIGITFRPTASVTAFISLSQSARAPTPVELACANEDAPCSLPNAFLADPPLDEVVARTLEVGVRGVSGLGMRWHAGAFLTLNRNDILFQTTGGAQANVGFFDSVSDTRRADRELGMMRQQGRLSCSAEYSYIEATFEDAFTVNSPNHPLFEDDAVDSRIVGEGKLLVPGGSSIPGIPTHQANLGLDFSVNDRLSLGADLVMRSGVYLRRR